MTQENFAEPVVLETRGQLSNAEINQWRTNGFVLVDNLLPEEVLKVLVEDAVVFLP